MSLEVSARVVGWRVEESLIAFSVVPE